MKKRTKQYFTAVTIAAMMDCCVDFDFLGVRPVLHIKLSSLDNSNYRMTKK